jgi:hypothetical protein
MTNSCNNKKRSKLKAALAEWAVLLLWAALVLILWLAALLLLVEQVCLLLHRAVQALLRAVPVP